MTFDEWIEDYPNLNDFERDLAKAAFTAGKNNNEEIRQEIIKALKECLDYEWLHAHNGKAKYIYLQTVLDIVNEKFNEGTK